MSSKIDIVIPYVNSSDKKWQDDYFYWVKKENIPKDLDQATSAQRFRDMGVLRYIFRQISLNCSWVNKVFLVVRDENQVPKWINKSCEKLRIVYHDEYIPKELLPTFNSNVIEMFLSNIDDLSDNYILTNDDVFFFSKIDKEHFFKGDKPVYAKLSCKYRGYDQFHKTLMNNQNLLEEIFPNHQSFKYSHLQEPHKKSVEKKILSEYGDRIKEGFKFSKFRDEHNFTNWLYNDYLKLANLGINEEYKVHYRNCSNMTLKDTISYRYFTNMKLVCINDTKSTKNFEVAKQNLISYLRDTYPQKSTFEK